MRHRYLVCYDISDPKRLKRVAQICEGYGIRFQLSVFECILDDLAYQKLKSRASKVMNQDEDQLLLVCLGPEEGQSESRYESVGRPPPIQTRVTVV
jgi:CRISPR-associated protein Cas2